jgi:hypothetical protein
MALSDGFKRIKSLTSNDINIDHVIYYTKTGEVK